MPTTPSAPGSTGRSSPESVSLIRISRIAAMLSGGDAAPRLRRMSDATTGSARVNGNSAGTNGVDAHGRRARARTRSPASSAPARAPSAPPARSRAPPREPPRDRRPACSGRWPRASAVAALGRPRRPRPRLHPREPAALVADLDALVPRRGPQHGQHPRARAGPARRQPLRRQPDPGHDRLHASLSAPTSASSGPSTSWPTTWCSPRRSARSCGATAPSAPPTSTPARRSRPGAAVLVYPGGDWEVHRPTWESGKVDFAGRRGFVRLARDAGVPIVPIVSVGGQETALFLSNGSWLARLLGVDRSLRLKVLPISVALPWVLNVGDFLSHMPLPAKLTIDVLRADQPRERFGHDPDVDEVYEHVTARHAGRPRRPHRRAPPAGDRLRRDADQPVDRDPRARGRSSGSGSPTPPRYLEFMSGITRWELAGRRRRRRASRAIELGSRIRMLIQVGSAEVGGLIEIVEFKDCARHGLVVGHRRRPARALAPARRRRGLDPGRAPLLLRRRRCRHPRPARRARRRADPAAAPAPKPDRPQAPGRAGGAPTARGPTAVAP